MIAHCDRCYLYTKKDQAVGHHDRKVAGEIADRISCDIVLA